MATFHIYVSGKVQGVFYRASAKEQAINLGLTGWVRNTDDDAVEIMVCGEDNVLQQFIEWCGIGSKGARVEHVETNSVGNEIFDDFRIVR